jgi:hypothetical protein
MRRAWLNTPPLKNAKDNAMVSTPMTAEQAAIFDQKMKILDNYNPPIWLQSESNDEITIPPPNSRPFIVTPAPFPNYPAPGAAATQVIAYACPIGFVAVVNLLAVVHVGGGFVDGSGNVIWRVLVNGAAVKGLANMQSQVGSYAQPNPILIVIQENDILQVTVEVPAAQPAMPAGTTTAARFQGYVVPINRK